MIGVEGRTVITEAVSWGRDPDDKSRQVFVPGGLGTNPSEAFANPRSDASSAVPRPVDSTGLVRFAGGTELREVVRRFYAGTIKLPARTTEAGLSAKFEAAAFAGCARQ